MMGFRRILVVEVMGGLGDVVLALPAIHALARSHPGASMHVLTLEPWHVLLEGDPLIDEVVPIAGRETPDVRVAAEEAMARIQPDLSVTTNRRHGLPELLEEAGGVAVTNLWRSPPPDEPVDQRYLALLAADGVIDSRFCGLPPQVALEPTELREGRDLLAALVPGPQRPVVLVPDSGMAVKRWPAGHWERLASALVVGGSAPLLVAEDRRPWSEVVATGAVQAPPLTLRQLAALFAAAAARGGVCVGGDTGPVRLATAAGLHAVGLYGPTSRERYGLHPHRGVNLQGRPECPERHAADFTQQVCWWEARCPFGEDGPACMRDISVEEVARALGV